MKECNIFVGRFQPLTMGHIKCMEKAYNECGLKTVLFVIDVPEHKVNETHPFTTDDTFIGLYRRILSQYDFIIDIVKVKSADILKISEECESLGYRIASWTCGADRQESYSKMVARYSERANLTDDFRMMVLSRNDGISATKVREYLMNNDFESFINSTPFTEMYEFDYFRLKLKVIALL